VLACVGVVLLFAGPVNAAETAYRRFFRVQDLRLEGTGFQLSKNHHKKFFLEGHFPDAKSLNESKVLDIQLEKALPPGNYVFWVKATGLAKRADDDLVLLMGPNGNVQTLSLPRGKGYCSGGVTFEAAKSFRRIGIRLKSVEPDIKLNRIYLSNQLQDLRAQDDDFMGIDEGIIISEMNSHAPSRQEIEPANYLANGSFEAGHGNYEWSEMYQSRRALTPANWDDSHAVHGKRSLRFELWRHRYALSAPPSGSIMTRVLKLRPGKVYYFRGYFRSDTPVSLNALVDAAYGKPNQHWGITTVNLDKEWKLVEMEVQVSDDDRGGHLMLRARSQTGPETWKHPLNVWADGLVLSAKKETTFVPAQQAEIGLSWSEPGKIFYSDSPISFDLIGYNHDETAPADVTCRYRVIDYFDRTVLDEAIRDWRIPAGSTAVRALELPLKKTGAYRLLIEGQTRDGQHRNHLQEYVFSVLPRPPEKMKNTFGAYINMNPEPLSIMSRAGIRRTVTLSCKNEFLSTWKWIEPERDKFIWWDSHVAAAHEQGVDIIANLELQDAPEWARKPKNAADALSWGGSRKRVPATTLSKEALTHFLTAMVEHYKNDIHEWLIVDEPDHYFHPEQYAELLKVAYPAIKKADPESFVWAHGGYTMSFREKVAEAGGFACMDGFSDYARDKEAGDAIKTMAAKYRKPTMGVEYSWMVSMMQTVELPRSWSANTFRNAFEYQDNGANLTQIPINHMAWGGAKRFNRYDARYPGGDFTQFDSSKCMFEYDGALKPSAVSYAITAQLLDGFHGVSELEIQPQKLSAFLLEDDKRFALVFWVRDKQAFQTELTLPKKVLGFDIMGNTLRQKPRTLLVSANPNYLIGPRDLLAETRAMLAACEFSPVIRMKGKTALDESTGQYVYEADVANLLDSESVTVQVAMTDKRNFWEKHEVLPVLRPGASTKLSIGLNAYADVSLPPVVLPDALLIKACGSAAGIKCRQLYRRLDDRKSSQAAAISEETLGKDLVAHWMFDEGAGETTEDHIGNNQGALASGAGWGKGIHGQALKLVQQGEKGKETGGFLKVKDSPGLSVKGSLTLTAWVKADHWGKFNNIVAKAVNKSYRWRIEKDGTVGMLILNDGKHPQQQYRTPLRLLPETWYHLAVIADFEKKCVRFFVNGDETQTPLALTLDGIQDVDSHHGSLAVGNVHTFSSAEGFSGLIDEVRVYARALTSAEVEAIFYKQPSHDAARIHPES